MSRLSITFNEISSFVFNSLKTFDCEQIPATEFGEDFKEFIVLRFSSEKKSYVIFLKPLTPSSRNPDNEYNFQVIDSQRTKIKDLAKKSKSEYIYAGWAPDLNYILIPSIPKVEKSANQGSIFMALDKLKEQENRIKDGVYVRILDRDEKFFSHCIFASRLGDYLNLLNKNAINLKDSPKNEDEEFVVDFLERDAGQSSKTTIADLSKPKNSSTHKRIKYPIAQNLILYGPPGTGKTRAANILANKILKGEETIANPDSLNFSDYPDDIFNECRNQYFATQFHPSFSYEDFFEGLRPVQIQTPEKSDITYLVVPGVFKAISQLARAYLEPEYGIDLNVQFILERDENGGISKKWHLGSQSIVGIYKLEERKGVLVYKGKKIQLTGKGHEEQLLVEIGAEPSMSGIYPLKWFSLEEIENKNFVIFIDELNRGNPAKIFGEALSLIEDTKRYGRKEQAQITLPYSREEFVVPPNLHLICSMNSSDKSLMNLDQAFRRRFSFVYFPPAFEIVESEDFKKRSSGLFSSELLASIKNHFLVINKALKKTGVSQENHIGHSYLLKLLRQSIFEIPQKIKDLEDSAKSKSEKITKEQAEKIAEDVVRTHLRKTWENELHGQIREIVGEFKLQEFCDNFATEASSYKKESTYLIANDDINKLLLKYLDDMQPNLENFPWKKSA